MTLATGKHIQPEQMRRAVAAYRRADELAGVPSDAGHKTLRIEGYVWLAFCLGMALCALLIGIYEAAGGWYGEAAISVLLALVFTHLAHRVLTEIRKAKDKAPGTHRLGGEGDAGVGSTGGE